MLVPEVAGTANGVSICNTSNRWRVVVNINNKRLHCGEYQDRVEAETVNRWVRWKLGMRLQPSMTLVEMDSVSMNWLPRVAREYVSENAVN